MDTISIRAERYGDPSKSPVELVESVRKSHPVAVAFLKTYGMDIERNKCMRISRCGSGYMVETGDFVPQHVNKAGAIQLVILFAGGCIDVYEIDPTSIRFD